MKRSREQMNQQNTSDEVLDDTRSEASSAAASSAARRGPKVHQDLRTGEKRIITDTSSSDAQAINLSDDDIARMVAEKRQQWLEQMQTKAKRSTKKDISEAEWITEENMAIVRQQRGKHILSCGVVRKAYKQYGSALWLYPEETLMLLDQGDLALSVAKKPVVSLDQAFSLLLASSSSLIDYFAVYAHLRRLGYVVKRREAPVQSAAASSAVPAAPKQPQPQKKKKQGSSTTYWLDSYVNPNARPRGWWLLDEPVEPQETSVPRLRKAVDRARKQYQRQSQNVAAASTSDQSENEPIECLMDKLKLSDGDEVSLKVLYRALQIVGTNAAQKSVSQQSQTTQQIIFNVWKPGTIVSAKNVVQPLCSIFVLRPTDIAPNVQQIREMKELAGGKDTQVLTAVVENGEVVFTKLELFELPDLTGTSSG